MFRAGVVAQVIEYLPSKHETLSSKLQYCQCLSTSIFRLLISDVVGEV
jgi:hypothetical protein